MTNRPEIISKDQREKVNRHEEIRAGEKKNQSYEKKRIEKIGHY